MSRSLRFQRSWIAIGMALTSAVVALSLIAVGQAVPVAGGDKVSHLLAYGALTFWWGMVYPQQRWRWAAVLMLLGLVLELAQALTPYRTLDYQDMLANGTGIALGLLLLATPLSGLLARCDQLLSDRFAPRQP